MNPEGSSTLKESQIKAPSASSPAPVIPNLSKSVD